MDKKKAVCGIVVEYNPFHSGHKHHIEETRKQTSCDVLIAVMSPHFVQRGDLAIVSTYERAKCAIQQGVDIVVELPYPYCVEHADKFAEGAIKVLKQLKIDSLCFGSETNDLPSIILEANKDQEKQQTTSMAYSNATKHSNDILAVAYLKAMKDTTITPLTIQRTNTYLSTTIDGKHASASAIRHQFRTDQQNEQLRALTPLVNEMKEQQLPQLSDFYPMIRFLLLTASSSYLRTLFLMDEGIEGLFQKQAIIHESFEDFISACVSKRYTKSRIMRTLCHLIMQTTKQEAKELEELSFVRILAMNNTGRNYIKDIRNEQKEIIKLQQSESINNEDTKPVVFSNKFNQLPKQYQEITLKMTRVMHYFKTKEVLEEAIKKELSFPILISNKE